MKFTPKFVSITLDIPAYMAEVDYILTRKLKESGRKWLDATVRTKTHIPTWSGASRATFQKLAYELDTTVPIGPIRARRNRVALGLANANGSGVFTNPKTGEWYFVYSTQLRYLAFNEYNEALPGRGGAFSYNIRYTPYGFQQKGRKAWLAAIKNVKLPNPFQYLKVEPI